MQVTKIPRTPFKKVFADKAKMSRMLALRKQGWSYLSLADLYGVDFSSIYHQCKLHNVVVLHKGSIFSINTIVATVVKPKHALCYEDYLKKAYPNRKWVEKNYI